MGGEVDVVTVYRTGLPDERNIEKIRTMLSGRTELTLSRSLRPRRLLTWPECWTVRICRPFSTGSLWHPSVPSTSGTLRENGLPVHVEALEYTVDGLVEALAKYFKPA